MGKIALNQPVTIDDRQFNNTSMPEYQVVAKPVDTFTPTYPSQQGTQLLQALNTFESAGIRLAKANYLGAQQDKETGLALAASKQELPQTASQAMAEGFWQMKGRANLNPLGNALQTLYQSNPNMTLEEWKQQSDAIQEDFIRGQNPAFLKGFVPGALALQEQYDRQVIARQGQIVKQDLVTNTGSAINQALDSIVGQHIASMDVGNKTLTEQNATPEQVAAYKLTQGNTTASKLSQALAGIQETAKQAGMTRLETSVMFAHIIGMKSQELRMPELNMWAELPIAGVRPIDNPEVAKIVHSSITSATSALHTYTTQARVEQDRAKKEDSENVERYLVNQMIGLQSTSVGASPDEVAKQTTNLLSKLNDFTTGAVTEANPSGLKIDPTKAETYRKAITELRTGEALTRTTDPNMWSSLYVQAFNGNLDMGAIAANQQFLNPKDAMNLLKISFERKQALQNHDESQDTAIFNKAVEDLKNVVGPPDPILTHVIDQYGPKRRQMAAYEMALKYQSFKAEGQNKRIDPTILQKWADEAEAKIFKQYPKGNSGTLSTPSSTISTPQPQSNSAPSDESKKASAMKLLDKAAQTYSANK